jgi:hypothetical protein
MKHLFTFVFALFIAGTILAQENTTTQSNPELPFFIDPIKRLPDFEAEDKKEGTFITGLPRLEFDPIRGFGVGGNLFLFFNKDRNDPFFEYTPYRHRLNAEFFIFENGRIRYEMRYDAPYIFDTPWRLRADAVLWEDPNAQYWGMGRSTLNPLRFLDKQTGVVRNWDNVDDYEDNLAIALPGPDGTLFTDFHYNHFIQREMLYNLLGERVMMGGKLRLMFGYEALFTSFQSYGGRIAEEAFTLDGEEVDAVNNQTLIEKQIASGVWEKYNMKGFNNSTDFMFTSMLAGALIYDTRDFEPDPSEGVFLEYSHEYSAPWLGSEFNFNKFMIQGQYIHTLARWRNNKSRLTFAGLAALGYVWGPEINFIEMWDLSSQAEAGGILVLGGDRSLRGFREARFMAPTIALVNLEMRTRLYDFDLWKQHFSVGLTPFFDFGSVWDSPRQMGFTDWRGNGGIGARLGWNQSTILRLDYAQSREGSQIFFGFNHIF